MRVRTPAVAGQFYPQSHQQCEAEVEELLSAPEAGGRPAIAGTAVGGIVPHAGWVCSGAVAGEVLRVLLGDAGVETAVVFGAVHRHGVRQACVVPDGTWSTPLGDVPIDEELAAAVADTGGLIAADADAHAREHSIEVQVPLIRHLAPSIRLLPVLVPPGEAAPEVGRAVAEKVRQLGRRSIFVGSTDLTHYGPRYGFTPRGFGPEGLAWAKDVNDRRMIDLILNLRAGEVVPESQRHHNACGAGAVAACIAASREAGATRAEVLRHTTSNEVLRDRYGEMTDAVGYVGIVFTGMRSAE